MDHITLTGHNIKWDHFDILATGRSDVHRKIKETMLIRDLQPAFNENVVSEKLFFTSFSIFSLFLFWWAGGGGVFCFVYLSANYLSIVSVSRLVTSLPVYMYICSHFNGQF